MSRVHRPFSWPAPSTMTVAVAIAILISMIGGCSAGAAPAAFTVSDLTVEASGDVLPGDAVAVVATIANTGGSAGTYTADLTVGGSMHMLQDVALAAGETTTVHFELRAGPPGDHTVRLADEVATIHVTGIAEFRILDLVLAGASDVVLGDEVTVVATVENVGTAAGAYQAELTVDGFAVGRQGVALDAGQVVPVRFRIPTGQGIMDVGLGDHEVRMGEAMLTVTVLDPTPAVFVVSSLAVTPNPVERGAPVTVAVTVENTGGMAGTRPLELSIDGKVVDSHDVTLAGGEQTTVVFDIDAPSAGRHTVSVGDTEDALVVFKITRPANGTVLVNKLKGGRGELTIRNGDEERDTVVLLTKSSKTLLAVYVRAGRSKTIKGIKDGTYAVYFRFGERWDGTSKTFIDGGSPARFEDNIKFKTTRTSTRITWTVVTISLHAGGGSSPTDWLDEDEFPSVP
jgi:hypothetical protein